MREISWVADYGDSTFSQYEEDKENLFGDVDMDNLHEFIVNYRGDEYIVDVRNGVIDLNGTIFSFKDLRDAQSYDLIYYVKNYRHMGVGPGKSRFLGHERYPCIGLKANIDGVSIKHIFMLKPDKIVMI